MMLLIDSDYLQSIKFHPLPYMQITPPDVAPESYKRGWNDVVDVVLNDADPVVKCSHCKKYDRHNHRCKWWNHGVSNVDWCSYAEKDGAT